MQMQTISNAVADLQKQITQTGFRLLNQVVVPAVKFGLANPLPIGPGIVIIETTGRKSGLPRLVPLVAARLGDKVLVSTVRESSQWVRNLEAEPMATVWLAGKRRPMTASVDRGRVSVATLTVGT